MNAEADDVALGAGWVAQCGPETFVFRCLSCGEGDKTEDEPGPARRIQKLISVLHEEDMFRNGTWMSEAMGNP